ncbi:MAG: glycosyl hydrolase family 17 protein [Candidatus Berkelbacteria bacterium]|nr:glycosyl hydrolase family 17 protein [Candidatus Berkelbacteria bacterium]
MKWVTILLVFSLFFVAVPQVLAEGTNSTKAQTSSEDPYFEGLGYGPFRGIQNPACGPYPTKEEVGADLTEMAKHTDNFRIYSTISDLGPFMIKKGEALGMNCLPGCWIGKLDKNNQAEIQSLNKAVEGTHVKKVVMGNEVLFNKFLSEDKLIELINKEKKDTGLKVGTAEIRSNLQKHPKLVASCDFVCAHIYAYWDGVAIEKAAKYVVDSYKELKAEFPGKEIILGETGWPKAGDKVGAAVASLENQKRFIREFTALAKKEKIPYYYFEAFDEEWKATFEGNAGSNWGVYYLKRSAKIKVASIDKFPFVVYDEISTKCNFVPSGWMGDAAERVKFEPDCKTSPYHGQVCTKITYDAQYGSEGWAGVYWQYPESNWGDLPGYDLKVASKLTFWARGENGTERVEFKVGGINSYGKKYSDSLPLLTLGWTKLGKDWKKYEIALPKDKQNCVISGFCWSASRPLYPGKMIFYLDQIQFE